MTTAAKKAAASQPAPETPAVEPVVDELPEPYVDPIDGAEQVLSSAKTGPAAAVAAGLATIALAEEQRTANLIAVLALGTDAWSDLFGAGVDEEQGPADVAHLVVNRLGIGGKA